LIDENTKTNSFVIKIIDDGYGMNEETLTQVSDPFFTTRTTRKVGLGISLFKMAAESTNGELKIESKEHQLSQHLN
jgi:signal transduction histidine kinase